MAQHVNIPVTKPDNLSLILRSHMVERENHLTNSGKSCPPPPINKILKALKINFISGYKQGTDLNV